MPLQSEIYERFRCENCGTNQMVYLGRDDDDTAPYVEVIECGKCGWLECIEEIPWFQQSRGLVDEATDAAAPAIGAAVNAASAVVSWHCDRSGAGLTYDDPTELEQCLRFVAEAPAEAPSVTPGLPRPGCCARTAGRRLGLSRGAEG